MTTAKPLARYSAIEGALASGFATAELHHLWERDRFVGLQNASFTNSYHCCHIEYSKVESLAVER
ncbi:hypothetical protein [Mesorhizobium sp. M0129]|uniref:hypothetical protein n=1 Tax=Mesorhizobium sp. M0129 TaxID=2956886 RepID=UPI00333D9E2D